MVLEAIWDWITGIPATIWGSLIAGILTLVGVILGQFSIYQREQEKKDRELEALRDALSVELQTMDEVLEGLLYAAHDIEKARANAYALSNEQYEETFKSNFQAQLTFILVGANEIPNGIDIYEANMDRIGELDSDEAESIIQTHKAIGRLYQSMQRFEDAISHDDLVFNEDVDWSSGAGLNTEVWIEKAQIESEIINAIVGQKMTLARLGHEPSDHDRTLVAYAISRDEPKSLEHDRTQRTVEKYIGNTDISFEDLPNGTNPS